MLPIVGSFADEAAQTAGEHAEKEHWHGQKHYLGLQMAASCVHRQGLAASYATISRLSVSTFASLVQAVQCVHL